MARKPILPPSLNQARGAPAPDETEVEGLERQHHNARIERNRELRKKRGARKRKVEATMRSLPLTDKAKSQVSAFVSAFRRPTTRRATACLPLCAIPLRLLTAS